MSVLDGTTLDLRLPLDFLNICSALTPGQIAAYTAKQFKDIDVELYLSKDEYSLHCKIKANDSNRQIISQSFNIVILELMDSTVKLDLNKSEQNSYLEAKCDDQETEEHLVSALGQSRDGVCTEPQTEDCSPNCDPEKIYDDRDVSKSTSGENVDNGERNCEKESSNYSDDNDDVDKSPSLTCDSALLLKSVKEESSNEEIKAPECNLDESMECESNPKTILTKGPESVPCIKCGKEFLTVQKMERHVLVHHKRDNDYAELVSEIEADRDTRRKNGSQMVLECPICGAERRGRRILTHVKQMHASSPKYAQVLSQLQQVYRAHWLQSRRSASQEEAKVRQACHFCGKQYSSTCIRNHIKYQCRVNPDRQPMKHCSRCGFKSAHSDVLQRHMEDKHSSEVHGYICDQCGWTGMSRSAYFNHQRHSHRKEEASTKSFVCHACGKVCVTKWELTSHMVSHSDDRPVKCTVCSKHFKSEASMNKHVKAVHLNKYPFHCQQCGHGVQKKAYLKTHKCERVRRKQQVKSDQEVDIEFSVDADCLAPSESTASLSTVANDPATTSSSSLTTCVSVDLQSVSHQMEALDQAGYEVIDAGGAIGDIVQYAASSLSSAAGSQESSNVVHYVVEYQPEDDEPLYLQLPESQEGQQDAKVVYVYEDNT